MMRLIHSLHVLLFWLALAGVSFANSAVANPAILFDLATGKVLQPKRLFSAGIPPRSPN